MHGALASGAEDPAFRPEPLAAAELAQAGASAAAEALTLLGGLVPGGPAEPLRARADDVGARLRSLLLLDAGGRAIRQHGDYHLGQVLWAGGEWLVLDFEGEPARPLAERRRKSTPLRDVAGMLRSFAYAAETMRGSGAAGTGAWERDARDAFLGGYHDGADASLLPAAASDRAQLLAACELEKALYELRYELDNRPGWVARPGRRHPAPARRRDGLAWRLEVVRVAVGREHGALVGPVAQHRLDVGRDGRGHADVAARRLGQEPAVLEDLVEQLGRLALAPQLGRDGRDRRLEHSVSQR